MSITVIRQKLHQFIDTIEDKKAEAIYTLFEEEIEKEEGRSTPELEAEWNQRFIELESGQVNGSSWEDVKQRARQSIADKK